MSDIQDFQALGLSEEMLSALALKGFKTPSPIQALTIPKLLTGTKDLIGQAQTGTGKTAAFGIPIIENAEEGCKKPQALILAPTRELSMQIAEEINYFRKLYGSLHPTVFLSYEREAYYCRDDSDFRVTFDDTVLCRQEELSLSSQVYGTPILPPGKVLMEIKCAGGIPLWMTRVLSEERIYKTTFSKYGTAYKTLIFPQSHPVNPYQMLEVTTNA
jgi:hypothetical protein